MTKNTLPNPLTCLLYPTITLTSDSSSDQRSARLHECRSLAHSWIERTVRNCDVKEVAKDYRVSIEGNIATFTKKVK